MQDQRSKREYRDKKHSTIDQEYYQRDESVFRIAHNNPSLRV